MSKLNLKIKLINACLPEPHERSNPLLEKRAVQLIIAKARAYEKLATEERYIFDEYLTPWVKYNYLV